MKNEKTPMKIDPESEQVEEAEVSSSPSKKTTFDHTQLPFVDFDEIPKDIDILDNVNKYFL